MAKRLTREQKKVRDLFRGFREREPKRIKKVRIEIPTHVAVLGTVEFIGYNTSHGSKAVRYTHEFAPGSRPLLCAGRERGQLFLVGGRFHVTERGIVDLDARGSEIDDDGGHR